MNRRCTDYCPVKVAHWRGGLIGFVLCLALGLLDAAVRGW